MKPEPAPSERNILESVRGNHSIKESASADDMDADRYSKATCSTNAGGEWSV